jgi:hypothetical protein
MLLYIDGTTGGLALQMLLGGAVGGLVVFKLAAKQLMSTIRPRQRSKGPVEESKPAASEESNQAPA